MTSEWEEECWGSTKAVMMQRSFRSGLKAQGFVPKAYCPGLRARGVVLEVELL
jgi:hypothetical protein